MRRSRSGPEKFHGAFIDHDGTGTTRTFNELKALGSQMDSIGTQIMGASSPSRVAVVFDWASWWGFLGSVGPSQSLDYLSAVREYYTSLHDLNVSVDVIGPKDDLSRYDLVLAPYLYMVDEVDATHFKDYVFGGGHLGATTMTAITDQFDRCHLGGAPGPLRDLCGVWAEETDALSSALNLPIEWEQGAIGGCSILFDVMRLEGASEVAQYGAGQYYSGSAAVTVNEYGRGAAYYVASVLDHSATSHLVQRILGDCGISTLMTPEGTYAPCRVATDGKIYRFYINSTQQCARIPLATPGEDVLTKTQMIGDVELGPYETVIVREDSQPPAWEADRVRVSAV